MKAFVWDSSQIRHNLRPFCWGICSCRMSTDTFRTYDRTSQVYPVSAVFSLTMCRIGVLVTHSRSSRVVFSVTNEANALSFDLVSVSISPQNCFQKQKRDPLSRHMNQFCIDYWNSIASQFHVTYIRLCHIPFPGTQFPCAMPFLQRRWTALIVHVH